MERPIRLFWAIMLLLPSLVSAIMLGAGLGILFWLSLHHVPNAHAAGFTAFLDLEYSGLDNYIAIARTYLQRQAMLNTGLVTIITWLLALPLAILLANLLAQSRRTVLIFVTLIPVVMPTALGALAWRKLFDLLYPIYNSDYTIVALAVIQTWRVLPIMGVILLFSGATRVTRLSYPAIGLSFFVSTFLIVIDVSVGLIFTAREPLNQMTPLWGTWAFQLGYTAGNFGQSAASLVSLIPLLMVLVLPLPVLVDHIQWCYPFQNRETTTLQRLGSLCIGLFFLLPLIALFFQPASIENHSDLLSQLHYLFIMSDYRQWVLNSTLIWCGASLVVMLLGLSAGYSLVRPLANLLLWISLIAGSVAFVPLAWASHHWTWVHSRWFLAWLYGACTAPIVAWLIIPIINRRPDITPSRQRESLWLDTKFSTYWVWIISIVLIAQPFNSALALNSPTEHQTLSMGIITQLANDPTLSPIVVGLAICLPTLLGILILRFVLRTFLSNVWQPC